MNVRNGRVVKTSDGGPTGGGVRVISVVGGRWVRTMLVGAVAGSLMVGDPVAETDTVVGRLVCVLETAEVGSFVTVSEGTFPMSPKTSLALSLLTHPTLTPAVFLIGMAKH